MANARNVIFRISFRWPIHIINPVDKTKLSCYTSHQPSTTVSLETYPPLTRRKPIDGQFDPNTDKGGSVLKLFYLLLFVSVINQRSHSAVLLLFSPWWSQGNIYQPIVFLFEEVITLVSVVLCSIENRANPGNNCKLACYLCRRAENKSEWKIV